MPRRQPLPLLWLLSDARNDARLEQALQALPRESGFVFRHYHLEDSERRGRFDGLATLAREYGHLVVLSRGGDWGADGVYGNAEAIAAARDDQLRIATAHDRAECDAAVAKGADAIFVSPVFATRTHPGAPVLGPQGFAVLAQATPVPLIALGGMTAERAREYEIARWGAIDGIG